MKILKISNKKDNKFLRKKTAPFDFNSMTKDELRILINDMKETMRSAEGVGLSANQVGVDASFFVAEVEDKFYAIFNPEIVKTSTDTEPLEQGCLSVSDKRVDVTRPYQITLKGFDKNKKRLRIKAWGFLAHVFQHEVDHLNGKLITDYK
ncbi:MAG: peptide deformylase [Candidatus Colwellbacteria bacterium RIFCSPLOWO2_02_FULL_45_11]|uniref:Peptide deformylase n=2 Tax=Parcubacteria group TaxID=1794811 RepID=A0A0H4T7S8_9BACT|nr:peptide deformylase, peptide deformylase [uncultured Parcubacteria bacterium Rifle_16ft_4_minimus_37647]OGY61107.1 MAG: peptide deformylase [Candidatus Colwellbacteria bacterium RIFCSPLOWO2_02_FULL_45_11]